MDHELAPHTYSHLLADEATAEELDDELSTVDELHADVGLRALNQSCLPTSSPTIRFSPTFMGI
jgi:peptidoglycan/xylan/chitin deacetylase (PgdA/CDA1 family)